MGTEPLLDRLQADDVVVFVGAHPDDETLVGPLLAYCADHCRELVVVSLTRGQSGWNLAGEDLTRTLAEVRQAEFASAVGRLGGEPVTWEYVNGTSTAHPQGLAVRDVEETAVARWRSPGGRDVSADAVYDKWIRQGGDPSGRLADLLGRRGATIVIALDPKTGVTNHPEHVAATRAAAAGVQACNERGGAPIALYYVVRPPDAPPAAERIATADLTIRGSRDYGAIAHESHAFYASQYRPERFADPAHRRTEQWVVRAEEMD
ncbi:MAG: PIG-L family deacetylase [Planctomycetes bacterium]|nr:PIG-L family deacetylase [Planctomycetota bacterium]